MEMHRTLFVLIQLLCIVMHRAVEAQLISIESFQAPSDDGTPNTFIGTGRQIASSLLDATTPALMYGVVSSAHVTAVCQHLINSSRLCFDADVVTPLGSSTKSLTLQITATGGCTEASDASGTEAIMIDDSGRQNALVCPSSNAGSTGCAIYLIGDDVTALYHQGSRRRLLARRALLHKKCADEARKGAISGIVTGILSVAACSTFTGPLAPLCAAGMLGASAGLGAAAGCASSCFPGDATVRVANGELKRMTALTLGDKVAVRKRDGSLAYEDVYAFRHKDESAPGKFLQLTLKPIHTMNMSDPAVKTSTLELTSLHFVPVSSGHAGDFIYKRAQDIRKGDKLWAHEARTYLFSLHVVTSISDIVKQGLYNPFTLGGTIVVNGVVASTHSDWFLDSTFQFFNLVHWLPAVYQLVLFPVRMLYHGLDTNVYTFLYQSLDSFVNVFEFGGNTVVSVGAAASGVVVLSIVSKVMVSLASGSERE